MNICSYGCGKEAKYFFKTGNMCCEASPNKCEGKRKIDSEKKKGTFKGTPAWNIDGFVYNPWNKGKTNVYSEETKLKISNSLKGKSSGKGATIEKEIERKEKISKSMKSNPNAGGYRVGSGRGNKMWYESNIAGRVFLDSSYEYRLAVFLDSNNINWTKNKIKFPYVDEDGKDRYYTPDFYLKDLELYIETKGFKTIRDDYKWNQFPYKLKVMFENDLIQMESVRMDEDTDLKSAGCENALGVRISHPPHTWSTRN